MSFSSFAASVSSYILIFPMQFHVDTLFIRNMFNMSNIIILVLKKFTIEISTRFKKNKQK